MLLEIESVRAEPFSRTAEAHRLAWSGVQWPGNGIESRLSVPAQVGTLGQVLSQQSIGVLVDAALPRAVQIGKVHFHPGGLSQTLVLGHFPTLIVSRRQWLLSLDPIEHAAKATQRRFRTGVFYLGQHREQGCALNQRSDSRAVVRALEGRPIFLCPRDLFQ